MSPIQEREAQSYLIGRLLLDGATPSELAQRFAVNLAEIDVAWDICQEKLSFELTRARGEPFRRLGPQELRAEIATCLRCLLDWREERLRSVDLAQQEARRVDLLRGGLLDAAHALECLANGEVPDGGAALRGSIALDLWQRQRLAAPAAIDSIELTEAAEKLRALAGGGTPNLDAPTRERMAETAQVILTLAPDLDNT